VVEIDVLDFILGVYLVQKYLDRWHLVIYYSYKMTPLELNYNIYNKELLGIVVVLKE
jgi:RNase H-like domain found in reverse transcriptase